MGELWNNIRKKIADYRAKESDKIIDQARRISPKGHEPTSRSTEERLLLEEMIDAANHQVACLEEEKKGLIEKNEELDYENKKLIRENESLEEKTNLYEASVENMRQEFLDYFNMLYLDKSKLEEINNEDLLKRTVERYKCLVGQLKSRISQFTRGEFKEILQDVMINFGNELITNLSDEKVAYVSSNGVMYTKSKKLDEYNEIRICDFFSDKHKDEIKKYMEENRKFKGKYNMKKGKEAYVTGIPIILSEDAISYIIYFKDVVDTENKKTDGQSRDNVIKLNVNDTG